MMENDIITAILNKKIITFLYDGANRTCEPHIFGLTNNKNQVLCYQIQGGSVRGGIPEWRRFDLGGISDLVVTDDEFPGVRPIPTGPHSKWDTIILVVE